MNKVDDELNRRIFLCLFREVDGQRNWYICESDRPEIRVYFIHTNLSRGFDFNNLKILVFL